MRLHAVCGYRSYGELGPERWTKDEYRALTLVKAVKHEPFKGYDDWKGGGKHYRVENTPEGQRAALFIAANKLIAKLRSLRIPSGTIVPVPSSKHTAPGTEFTGSRVVSAIENIDRNFVAAPVLYFDRELPKSAGGGGPRRPERIKPHLRMTAAPLGEPVILFDDVCTTGGHLRAAASFMRDAGIEVDDAIVIARTVGERPEKMWEIPSEHLDCEF